MHEMSGCELKLVTTMSSREILGLCNDDYNDWSALGILWWNSNEKLKLKAATCCRTSDMKNDVFRFDATSTTHRTNLGFVHALKENLYYFSSIAYMVDCRFSTTYILHARNPASKVACFNVKPPLLCNVTLLFFEFALKLHSDQAL